MAMGQTGRLADGARCQSEGNNGAQMVAPPLGPAAVEADKKHESADAGEIGSGRDWCVFYG